MMGGCHTIGWSLACMRREAEHQHCGLSASWLWRQNNPLPHTLVSMTSCPVDHTLEPRLRALSSLNYLCLVIFLYYCEIWLMKMTFYINYTILTRNIRAFKPASHMRIPLHHPNNKRGPSWYGLAQPPIREIRQPSGGWHCPSPPGLMVSVWAQKSGLALFQAVVKIMSL